MCCLIAGADCSVAAEDRLVKSWSCERGEQLDSFKVGKAAVHRLALSADDTHVLLSGTTMIRLMRREGWKRLQRLPGNAEPVSCLCFAPHEQFALSSADKRHLSLWHTSPQVKPTEACMQTLALDFEAYGSKELRGSQLARHSSWLCVID